MRASPLARATAAVLLAATSAAGPPPRATAAELPAWIVVAEGSSIQFDYVLDGKPASGVFRAFGGSGSFDAARPAAATLTLVIETGSVDLGSAIVNAFATSAEGFHSAGHPEAVYRLTALAPVSDGTYTASGTLTIKGRTAALSTPVTLSVTPEAARAEGLLRIDRTRFGLGVGPFAALIDMEPMVAVHFVLNARPVR